MLKNYRNRVPTLANSFSSSKELEVSALNKATTPMPSSLSVRKKAYSHKAASKPQRKRYINSRRKQRLIKKFKVKCSLLALVPTDAFKILLTTMCIRLETEKKNRLRRGPLDVPHRARKEPRGMALFRHANGFVDAHPFPPSLCQLILKKEVLRRKKMRVCPTTLTDNFTTSCLDTFLSGFFAGLPFSCITTSTF